MREMTIGSEGTWLALPSPMSHLAPDTRVPALRNDLAFSRNPHGLGTHFLSIKNVSSGEEYRLRGFEHSLARMLDGKRTAAEVIIAAEQVGLPVTLEDLDGFVKKLADRHLVAPAPASPMRDEVPPFEAREPWDEATRKLFRLALKEGRAGNLNRALIALDCLLHERPNTDAAIALRDRLEEWKKLPEGTAPFSTIFAEAELGWHADELKVVQEMDRRGNARLATAGVFVAFCAIALAVALIPFPHQVNRPATLFPIASVQVPAPRTGKVASVEVKTGQWVEKDAVLFTYDVSAQVQQLEQAVKELGQRNAALRTGLARTPAVEAARARYGKAEARLAAAQSLLDDERANDGEELIDAEQGLDAALQETADARRALEALAPRQKLDALHEQQAEVQRLELLVLDNEVKAPISGALTVLSVEPGADVLAGLDVAQLDDTRKLKAVALIGPRDRKSLAPGQEALLFEGSRATNTVVTNVSARTAEVVIDNAAGSFEPGEAQLQIRGRPVSALR